MFLLKKLEQAFAVPITAGNRVAGLLGAIYDHPLPNSGVVVKLRTGRLYAVDGTPREKSAGSNIRLRNQTTGQQSDQGQDDTAALLPMRLNSDLVTLLGSSYASSTLIQGAWRTVVCRPVERSYSGHGPSATQC